MSSKALSISERHQMRAISNSKKNDAQELDVRLDLLLGAPENLSAYQDCIAGARFEGAKGAIRP